MYPRVTLDQCQVASGIYQANERQSQSQAFGHSDQRGLSPTDAYNRQVQGSLGEVAAHVFFNRPFSYSINRWNDPDLVTARGLLVDVKASTNPNWLNVSPRHLHDDWYYLLVWQRSQEEYSFVGYMRGSEIAEYELTDNARKSPYYKIPAEDLTPVI